ncbi:MAG: hypothetical protein U5J62_09375 [Desulfurivibrio sp.]|nr:hypothetical protein [Desulfurivibrio sp.]
MSTGNDCSVARELWRAMDDYEAMQEEHLTALRAGRVGNVVQWQAERERAFQQLRYQLDAFGDLGALTDGDFAAFLSERLGGLLATENRLQKEVREGKRRLREQQAALRKGKNAMRRITPRADAGPRPRFISSMA